MSSTSASGLVGVAVNGSVASFFFFQGISGIVKCVWCVFIVCSNSILLVGHVYDTILSRTVALVLPQWRPVALPITLQAASGCAQA